MRWVIRQKFNLKENPTLTQKLLDTEHKILIEDTKGQARTYRDAYFGNDMSEDQAVALNYGSIHSSAFEKSEAEKQDKTYFGQN
jgi:hypothetical protein